ncbi:UDP-N-acetylmuramyl pentapeptide phosphotransferase/UDP-N-acetylglucosamine-1-phosphate transferase [Pseudoduganella lurida]|uniref:UDP-N-acetylmuramyl pentapeptide phosphotransferase/UDP-N-acetylglucosamine-1-phosphate transferase n=1 Tax=Pseudoduganella lurida TaxID=1036180 RepID=A0A562R5U1_9BURK|nr:glycosyltransferase [Pseudoduganella lurida]TWI64223.1 UDP-N-acetylmuramyl pentapeptide phosphotransferase/UDP-N-acetylglucosamine-1-phosphate transferase [Pseudoduganella lurida]
MFSFLVSFVASALLTLLVIKESRLHGPALDADFNGVQKVHAHSVARIGGLSIFLAVALSACISIWRVPALTTWMLSLMACSSCAFVGGIVEDYTGRVSAARRLFLTMVAALLGYYLLDARIDRIDWIDAVWPLPWIWLTLPLTILSVAGIANAVNIIDGFNGLASVVTICMLLSLGYVALQVNDMFVLVAALMVAGATAGFLIWNYPVGLIFLGDGGAYFIGFMLGELALLLVMRNPQVSTWYAALLLIYPAFETLFSVYRRMFIRGKSPAMPDGIHLHSLIFRRVVQWAVGRKDARALMRRNSLTSPYLWMFSLMAVIPATVFWRHTGVLMLFCALFIISYVWLYVRIVRFKAPRWMIRHKRNQ